MLSPMGVVLDFSLHNVHSVSPRVAWLWRFHAFHHSSERVYWLNGEGRLPRRPCDGVNGPTVGSTSSPSGAGPFVELLQLRTFFNALVHISTKLSL